MIDVVIDGGGRMGLDALLLCGRGRQVTGHETKSGLCC